MTQALLLLDLPTDILIAIIHELDAIALAEASLTCRPLKTLIDEFGWTYYLRINPRPSLSLSEYRSSASARQRVRYDALVDRSWAKAASSEGQYVARPLSRQWRGKLQPILATSPYHLFVAAGRILYVYTFDKTPNVALETVHTLSESPQTRSDVTSMALVYDHSSTWKLLLGFQNGGIEELSLQDGEVTSSEPDFAFIHGEDLVQKVRVEDDHVLSVSAFGGVALTNTTSSTVSQIALERRTWASFMSLKSSTPFIALGTSCTTPLSIYSFTSSCISTQPIAKLAARGSAHSSVYDLTSGPPCSPWGASPNILVSGWYDGRVRCYDLRTPIHPVMTVSDPLLLEPIYSVSCGGGSGSHIAAGTARHSVVSFWDVRMPKLGWSVHAPGNDSSPVYDIVLESSGLFGATQSRPFVLDFGPDITKDTYPPVARNTGRDGLVPRDDIGFYVTQYSHNTKTIRVQM